MGKHQKKPIPFKGFFKKSEKPKAFVCEWPGCKKPGDYPAPKRGMNGQHHFCLEHVREYNKRWNFFDGMSGAEIDAFYEDALVGHRKTYKREGKFERAREPLWSKRFNALFAQMGYWQEGDDFTMHSENPAPRNNLTKEENKAFRSLELNVTNEWKLIRKQYKKLVKQYHPDQHGGDAKMTAKLKTINEAYDVLKKRFG